MPKPDTDYYPHVICIDGLIMGIWATKHGAVKVAEAMYGTRSWEVHFATAAHYRLFRKC